MHKSDVDTPMGGGDLQPPTYMPHPSLPGSYPLLVWHSIDRRIVSIPTALAPWPAAAWACIYLSVSPRRP